MKRQNKTVRVTKCFPRTALMTALTLALSAAAQAGTSYDANGNVSYDKTGDLTIYQASTDSNNPTLTLMLDRSGSMRGNYSFVSDETVESVRVYRACQTNSQGRCYNNYRYYFSSDDAPSGWGGSWTTELTVKGLVGQDDQLCVVGDSRLNYAPIYQPLTDTEQGVTLEYCLKDGEKVYDRMSKLKLALLELLAFDSLNEDILLGVGAFGYSYQGRIQVPAAPLNTAQKTKIINFLKNLNASGGTPMATAFTEAGAYMLGTSSLGNYLSTPTISVVCRVQMTLIS